MLGSLGNIASLLKQAQTMKKQMEQLKEQMAARTYDADSGGGAVVATVNGQGDVVKVRIDPQYLTTEQCELVEDLIVAAVNGAVAKSRQAMQEEMTRVTGGLDLGNLGGLLGGK